MLRTSAATRRAFRDRIVGATSKENRGQPHHGEGMGVSMIAIRRDTRSQKCRALRV